MNKNTKTTQVFLKELEEMFGDFYDYSKLDYKHSKQHVHIICPIHGDCFRKPNTILTSGFICKGCGIQSKTSNTAEFIEKAKKVHGIDKFDYSKVNYVNNYTNVLIRCIEHDNTVNVCPKTHLKGYLPCSFCRLKKQSVFLEEVNKIHDFKYDYSLTKYAGALKEIKVICPKHGEFETTASAHLQGSGCNICTGNGPGHSKTQYVRFCKDNYNGLSNFYIVKLSNETEEFYKIGITVKHIDKRYTSSFLFGYQKENILILKNLPADVVYDLEKHFLKSYRQYKYIPSNQSFHGKTECLKKLPEKYEEIINDYLIQIQNRT